MQPGCRVAATFRTLLRVALIKSGEGIVLHIEAAVPVGVAWSEGRLLQQTRMTNEHAPAPENDAPREAGSGTSDRPLKPRSRNSRARPPAPRGGRLCERRELLESLNESLENRVTLIIAPAGYGKTTLLAQWCRIKLENQIPVAYYSASEHDVDPAMFLLSLIHI